ncbi:MAG: hypothetical protein ABI896_03695 [Actinomycetota bacterium]
MRKQTSSGDPFVGAFVDSQLKEALVASARSSEWTISGEVRFALRRHLAESQADRAPVTELRKS